MENFKKASKEKLRFGETGKGYVTVEDLWDMSILDLDNIYKILNKAVKESDEESYIKIKNDADETLKLKIGIVTEIIDSKIEESNKIKNEAENKIHNEKILRKIAEIEDNELNELGKDELKKMLK